MAATPTWPEMPHHDAAYWRAVEEARKLFTQNHTLALLTRLRRDGYDANPHHDGVRISVPMPSGLTRYVFVMPWSRGWSIFASANPDQRSFDWRNQPKEYRSKQSPVYVPKGLTGPWHADLDLILDRAKWVVSEFRHSPLPHTTPAQEAPDDPRQPADTAHDTAASRLHSPPS